jgi:hypothetical protein
MTFPKSGAGGSAPPGNPGSGGVALGAYGSPEGAAPNPGCGGTPNGSAGDGVGPAGSEGSAAGGTARADGNEEDDSEEDGTAGAASAGNEPGRAEDAGADGADGTCADCGEGDAVVGTGARRALFGPFGRPACSKKYGVALGVRLSALNINSSGVGVPNNSAKSVGAGRTSASFGNGLAAKGGV